MKKFITQYQAFFLLALLFLASDTICRPVDRLSGVAVDIHVISGDVTNQYIAYHYCRGIGEGHSNCVIFDGMGDDAKIISNEEIISSELYERLPEEEKYLWHSKVFAVQNGILVLPGLSVDEELEQLARIIDTYGKITEIPRSRQGPPNFYGSSDEQSYDNYPKLSYGLTYESQVNYDLVTEMEKALNLTTTYKERKEQRKGLVPKSTAQQIKTDRYYYQYQTFLIELNVEGQICSEPYPPIVYSRLEFDAGLIHVHLNSSNRNRFLEEGTKCFVYGNCQCKIHPTTLERVNVCEQKIPCCAEDRRVITNAYAKDVAIFLLYEPCRIMADQPGIICGRMKVCTTKVPRYRRNFAVCQERYQCLDEDERDPDYDETETEKRRIQEDEE